MHFVLAYEDVFVRLIKCKIFIVDAMHFIQIDTRYSIHRVIRIFSTQHIAARVSLLWRQY